MCIYVPSVPVHKSLLWQSMVGFGGFDINDQCIYEPGVLSLTVHDGHVAKFRSGHVAICFRIHAAIFKSEGKLKSHGITKNNMYA
jgi:hypothetical protein